MEKVKVWIPSRCEHSQQITTGFLMLKEKGWDVEIMDVSAENTLFSGTSFIQAEYKGKKIIYDVMDGYYAPKVIQAGLNWADFYFKRSFSAEKNAVFFPEDQHKIFPLGFNYHMTYKNCPDTDPGWKILIRKILGRYYVPSVFEGHATAPKGKPRIIFFTRLWDVNEPGLTEALQEERRIINKTRIDILRVMKQRYGDMFVGGLNDVPLSREMAPELIVSDRYTKRRNYIALLHTCDICIGSMGLHESIGWKTGEYVAAAKAIVNETFRYSVPGDFLPGKNYLKYDTAEECIAAVQTLVEDPQLLLAMKTANEEYYRKYLRPDAMIANTLKIVENTVNSEV